MNDTVQVTLNLEDWERIVRLVQGVVPVATQSVEDAYEWDEDEGPDTDWIEAREQSARDARAFADRVTAAVAGKGEAAPRQAGTAEMGEA